MSRCGYDDDLCSENQIMYINWRGAVTSAIRGRRGQAFLRELLEQMDAMPIKRLIKDDLVAPDRHHLSISHWGMYEVEHEGLCALGVVGKSRGIDMTRIDPEDMDSIHAPFDIANAMAREIEFINDDCGRHRETPEERFDRVRKWVIKNIRNRNDASE